VTIIEVYKKNVKSNDSGEEKVISLLFSMGNEHEYDIM